MKYRFTALVGLFLMALSIMAEGQAKYVFYFIGDGMGKPIWAPSRAG